VCHEFSAMDNQRDRLTSSGVDRTSASMLQQAAAGDSDGWQRLVTTYGPVIYAWSRRAGLRPEDAADIVQEVLRGVARNLAGFRKNRPGDTFRGWLRRITQRRIVDFRRRQRPELAAAGGSTAQARLAQEIDPVTEDASRDGIGGVIRERDRLAISQVQAEFSRRNWQIFWRTIIDERDTADVAEEFGVSANVVRLAKSRILKRLREVLVDRGSSSL
jgi:RNA polymerase sigma-70 factor, ECF subfamily